ncbi:hypothetical protein P7K49_024640 [Saguinus oedipus]|uniref:Uncharacterized protein n=1 Tax=Saguinus oedipus TaxID=9490 RepID=A0ABQ9UQW2_SAGOE|nr:hypothetical protein P7K49_024640 [Saguinus oedipus]
MKSTGHRPGPHRSSTEQGLEVNRQSEAQQRHLKCPLKINTEGSKDFNFEQSQTVLFANGHITPSTGEWFASVTCTASPKDTTYSVQEPVEGSWAEELALMGEQPPQAIPAATLRLGKSNDLDFSDWQATSWGTSSPWLGNDRDHVK